MRAGFARSLTATWLVLVLAVLHSGLPTHSHRVDPPAALADEQVQSADHHSHGTLLLEQTERVQSTPVQLPALSSAIEAGAFFAPVRRISTVQAGLHLHILLKIILNQGV